jgi:hypothetical protein
MLKVYGVSPLRQYLWLLLSRFLRNSLSPTICLQELLTKFHENSTHILVTDIELFDFHESMHRDTTMKKKQDALYRLIYYSKSTLHVSGDIFAHYQ